MEINCGSILGVIRVQTESDIINLANCFVGRTVLAEETNIRYTITECNSYGVPIQWERIYSQDDYDAVVSQLDTLKEELDVKIRNMQSGIETATSNLQSLQQRVSDTEEQIRDLSANSAFIKTGSMLSIPMDGGTCYVELIGIDPTATADNFEITTSGFTFTQEPTLTELGNAQGFVMIEFAVGANTTNENGITGSMTIVYNSPSGETHTGTVILKQAYKSANPTYLVTYVDGTTENRYEVLVRSDTISNKNQIKALRFYSAIQLGDYAFKDCTNLETLTFDNGSQGWGDPVFCNCSKLKEVNLVDVDFGAIGSFEDCKGLEKVTINRTSLGSVLIGNRYFSRCTALKNVVFGNNVNSVTLGTACFETCSSLESITSSDSSVFSLDYVSRYTFNGCSSLTDICFNLNSVSYFGEYAFWLCSKLNTIKNLTLNSLTYIDQKAFGFSAIESLVATNLNINRIGYQAFNSSALKNIKINKGNYSTSEDVFLDCASLTSIKDESGNNLIPQLTTIAKGTFRGCSSLSITSINSSLQRIEDYTFMGCGSFSASLPSGLTYIGISAFEDCASISFSSLPSGVTAINTGTFRASGLTAITIHSGVTIIDYAAFESTKLARVTFESGSTLESIGERAFFNSSTTTLKDFVIPDSVTTLGQLAFYQAGLKSLVIGKNVSKIPYYCFPFNNKLKDIYIRKDSTNVVPQDPSDKGTYNAFFGAGQEYFDNSQGATNKQCKLHLPFVEGTPNYETCKENYLDKSNHWNDDRYGLQLSPLLVTPVSGSNYTVPEGWVIVGN